MYQVPQHIDKNKVFIVQRSEIEGRLDPKMALYNRKVQSSQLQEEGKSMLENAKKEVEQMIIG